ncbi:hypothetical protein QBC39DRAFT_47635 [Podospora conica]|nr:hypothetical protein QBC39DRAFT_47635 [Schizothecium conicum]
MLLIIDALPPAVVCLFFPLCSIDRFDETIFPRDQDNPDLIPANLSHRRRRHHGNRPNPRPPAALLWYMSVVIRQQRPPGCVYLGRGGSLLASSFGCITTSGSLPSLREPSGLGHHHTTASPDDAPRPHRHSQRQPNPRYRWRSHRAASRWRGVSENRTPHTAHRTQHLTEPGHLFSCRRPQPQIPTASRLPRCKCTGNLKSTTHHPYRLC